MQCLQGLSRPKYSSRTIIKMFTIYVIFHKFLVPECYETLSGEDISEHVRFMEVNAAIPKEIPNQLAHLTPYIIQERELTWYNPFLQHNRFCESSAFFHVWKNSHLIDDYTGFIHYDMLLKKEAIEFLKKEIAAATAPLVFTQMTLVARPHLTQVIKLLDWEFLVQFYNILFEKRHRLDMILDKEIPLYHSFVLHISIFDRMMYFVEKAIPYLFEMLNYNTTHMPFMLERLHGVFLALDALEGTKWIPLPGVIHQDRLKDTWKGAL